MIAYLVVDSQGHAHSVDADDLRTDGNWLRFLDDKGRTTHLFLAPISVCGRPEHRWSGDPADELKLVA